MARSIVGLLAFSTAVFSQGIITTVTGTDLVFPGDGKPALLAPLGKVTAVVADSQGVIYFADANSCIVGRLNSDATITVIAGNGFCDSSGDGGPARLAGIEAPSALAIDSQGNLYIGTLFDVRKITTDGIITTVAGSSSADQDFPPQGGPATQYSLEVVTGLAVDAVGNLYISDSIGQSIRKVTPNGVLTTVAGTGAPGYNGDGPGTATMLDGPAGLAADAAGGLLFADSLNGLLRRINPDGTVSTLLKNVPVPTGVRLYNGSLYMTVLNGVIKFTSAGVLSIFAGSDPSGFSGDGGKAILALFHAPNDIAFDSTGAAYLADLGNSRIRKIGLDGIVNTVAGNGKFRYLGEGTPALATPLAVDGILKASFVAASSILLDPSGALYVTQTAGNRVSKIANGVVTTVIGTGDANSTGDGGPAINASLISPLGLARDLGGNLYVWEGDGITVGRIRKITLAGTVSTFADRIVCPVLATDASGTLYGGCLDGAIRKFSSTGSPTVIAGTPGQTGFSGDGGQATKAQIGLPLGVAFDAAGNMYISDASNSVIRKVDGKGVISTITAVPTSDASSGDGGPAKNGTVALPAGLTVDAAGNLYVSEFDGNRVREISATGVISTFAGGGTALVTGDGKPATQASVYHPVSLAFDQTGDMFILDLMGSRIREVLASTPSVQVPQTSFSLNASSLGAPVHGTFSVTGSIPGLDFQIATDSTAPWLTVGSSTGATPRLVDVIADPASLSPGTYHAVLTVRPSAAQPSSLTVNVTLTVGQAQPANLVADQRSLSFTFPKGATKRDLDVLLSNTGSGTVNFSVAATSARISVSPSSGSVSPGKPVSIAVTGDPGTLSPGTYRDVLTITGSNVPTISIPVSTTVSTLSQALLLTQSGLSFTAVAQGGVVPPQTFGVVNPGTGSLSWTASTSTLSGGAWLSVTPTSGTSVGASPAPQVAININQAGLTPGRYYGLVRVSAPAAPNTPQLVTVFLEVLPAASDPGAVIQPPELTFTTTSGRPSSQSLSVYGVGGSPKSFRTDHSGSDFVFEVLPADGTVIPAQPSQFVVQPVGTPADLFEFPQGVYKGAISFQFADGSVQSAKVTLISNPSSTLTGAAREGAHDAQTSCAPKVLEVSLTSLGQTFPISAGWPVGLSLMVQDNCGTPLQSGSVTASFSNGDPPISLTSLNDGTWQATWQAGVTNGPVSIHVDAQDPQTHILGSKDVTGNPGAQKDPPVFTADNVLSVFAVQPVVAYAPLAPGQVISIYGQRLADQVVANTSPSLPIQLSNTQVIIGGESVPLYYVSPTQVNAFMPVGINTNTRQQILIQNGPTYSQPVSVDVAQAQPTLLSAGGGAYALAYRGTQSFQVSAASPAQAGDILVLYAVGLGMTNPSVPDGVASPPNALTVAPVTVTIGGKTATVQYAGLAATFVGLYQINIVVPDAVTPGTAVPLSVSVSSQTGPSAAIAIQ